MEKSEILSHEIGHALIAFLFQNHYYTFEGVILGPLEKINEADLAYTISKPLPDFRDRVDADHHLAASIDGLLMLGGVAGLTLFGNSRDNLSGEITSSNFREYYNFKGSSGDFQIIDAARRPYGWYLMALDLNQAGADLRHFRILELLRNLFLKPVLAEAAEQLIAQLDANNKLAISDFEGIFDHDFVEATTNELIQLIRSDTNGLILLKNS